MDRVNPPVGIRFTPTDEQLVIFYLKPKNEDGRLSSGRNVIPQFNVYSCHPDQLPRDSQYGKENEFYFFALRQAGKSRKVGEGPFFWKSVCGKKKIPTKGETIAEKSDFVLSLKKGSKIKNMKWKMYEYSLVDKPTSSRRHKKRYVLCKIFLKGKRTSGGGEKENASSSAAMIPSESGSGNDASCSPHFSAETSSVISNEEGRLHADYEMQQQQEDTAVQGLSPASNWGNQAAADHALPVAASRPSPSYPDQNHSGHFLDTDKFPDNLNIGGLDIPDWLQQQEDTAVQGLSPASNWGNQAAADHALPAAASRPSPSCQDQNPSEHFPNTDPFQDNLDIGDIDISDWLDTIIN